MRRHYDYWGLKVAANRLWPALAPFESAGGAEADVRIEMRPTIPAQAAMRVTIGPRQADLQLAGVGRYAALDGSLIEVAPEAAARVEALELFLFGSAWGLLCYQRGLLPLHASVVERNGGAVAFCGPSGAGKSTLVAALLRRGWRLIGDDLCRCDPQVAGGALVWPSLPRLKLWQAALDALGESRAGLKQDLAGEDKFHWPAPNHAGCVPAPLRAIYVLEWGALGAERLRGSQALRQLVAAATYRADFVEAMGGLAAHWRACADIARRVPIFRLSRPRDWASLEAALALVDRQPEVAF
jgi:hypothetical protein